MSIILNLFGESKHVFSCSIPDEDFFSFEKSRLRNNLSLEDFYLDLEILADFGYPHWKDLPNGTEQVFFEINAKNRIEVKKKNTKILKIQATEILSQYVLFPLFITSESELIFPKTEGCQQLVFIEQEVGLVGKYKLATEKLSLSLLEFSLTKSALLGTNTYLAGIRYDNLEIKPKSQDTLVRSIRVIKL